VTRALRLEEHASGNLTEAIRWHEERNPGVGTKFLAAVEHTLDRIAARPEAGSRLPRAKRDTARRALVRRFPYQIVYYIREAEIVVVAVAHTNRRPDYWKRRRQLKATLL
jgi:plasmid stabilization system protein ParE